MKTLISIATIPLARLNNTEYIYFMGRALKLAQQTGADPIGVTNEFLSEFGNNIDTMTAILSTSQASDKTGMLAELDAQRDDLLVYLLATIRGAQSSPIAAQRTAAKSLYLTTKPYLGVQRMAVKQETQQLFSLHTDLKETTAAAHIATLALGVVVAELALANQQYDTITNERSAENAEKDLGDCKHIRTLTDNQYTYLTTIAQAFSLAMPSAEASKFVEGINVLIKETNTSYNQRVGQHKPTPVAPTEQNETKTV